MSGFSTTSTNKSELKRIAALVVAAMIVSAVIGYGAALIMGSIENSTTVPVFTKAMQLALPLNANAAPYATLNAVSCTGPGDCTAVGHYTDNSFGKEAMAATEIGGRFLRAVEIPTPSPGVPGPLPYATLNAVSCTGPGDCTAVGSYADRAGNQLAIIATEEGGKFSKSIVGIPGQSSGRLTAISCTNPGDCTAVGSGEKAHGGNRAIIVSEIDGRFSAAKQFTAASFPASMDNLSSNIAGVSCVGTGECTIVGSNDNPSNKGEFGFAAAETHGKYVTAYVVGDHSNADTYSFDQIVAISCPSSGDCTVVGNYYSYGNPEGMIASESAGKFSRVTDIDVPANVSGAIPNAISCLRPGNCVVVGDELHGNFLVGATAMIAIESGGRSVQARNVAPPGRVEATKYSGQLNGVSCTESGSCTAVGTFSRASNASQEAMVVMTKNS